MLARPITAEELASVPELGDVGLTDHHVVCTVGSNHLGQLLELLGRHGIRSLTSAPPTLEQLFMAQYRSSSSDLGGTEADPSAPEAATTR
jgi:ABC-2 type transport system ATP-binding protein